MPSLTMVNNNNADREWSRVSNTIQLLNLAVAQISLSLSVGDRSVDVVGNAFETLLAQIDEISQALKTGDRDKTNNEKVALLCRNAAEQTRSFIVAFQFYDELSQRMNHVSQGLTGLSDLIRDGSRFYDETQWQSLQKMIRDRYTIKDEIEMFDAVMSGMSIEEALQKLLSDRVEVEEVNNEVELF